MYNKNWLRENLISYLYEIVHNADYKIEEIADDIIGMIKEAKDNGTLINDIM